jgi:hypothetical protein
MILAFFLGRVDSYGSGGAADVSRSAMELSCIRAVSAADVTVGGIFCARLLVNRCWCLETLDLAKLMGIQKRLT